MKKCKLCRLSKSCNDIPGFCIIMLYATVLIVVGGLGYLFVTQELMV
jgi:hypothetical protein